MDSNILSQLIRELLVDNDRVSLPGIGSFVAEISPAYFSEDKITINPPSRKITFKSAEIWNDGLIEKYYAEKFKLDSDEASKELNFYFTELKTNVEAKKSIKFPKIGKLRSTLEGNLFFIMDENVDFNTGLAGLGSISLKDLTECNKNEDTVIKEEESGVETMVLSEVKSQSTEVIALKKQKRTIVFLNFFVAMLILVLLVLVFRAEISNLIEGILYTPQEIELLRPLESNYGC